MVAQLNMFQEFHFIVPDNFIVNFRDRKHRLLIVESSQDNLKHLKCNNVNYFSLT